MCSVHYGRWRHYGDPRALTNTEKAALAATSRTDKACCRCGRVKSLEDFDKEKRHLDGRASACKNCRRDRARVTGKTYRTGHKAAVNARVAAWRRANPARSRDYAFRRRSRIRDNWIETVDVDVLGLRHHWICQICYEAVDRSLRLPDPMSKTIDHIIPVSKGGEHSYRNTQLAHWICNTRRGATPLTHLATP